jgi:hypothetical protein
MTVLTVVLTFYGDRDPFTRLRWLSICIVQCPVRPCGLSRIADAGPVFSQDAAQFAQAALAFFRAP